MELEDALSLLAHVAGHGLDPALRTVLDPALRYWSADPLPRRSTLGPCGVILSTHLFREGTGAVRCDVEPPWEMEDPRTVHQVVDRLAEAAGAPGAAVTLRVPLTWAAWPPPGVGPGPYVGVSTKVTGASTLRCWGPGTAHARPPEDLLVAAGFTPATADVPAALRGHLRLLFAGVETAGDELVKLALYYQCLPGVVADELLEISARLGAAHDSGAIRELVSTLHTAHPDAYLGMALRLDAEVPGWRPVIEMGARGSAGDDVVAWLRELRWRRAAAALTELLDGGLLLSTVSVAGGPEGPAWVVPYLAPRSMPLPPGRGVPALAPLTEPVCVPDRPGALAQSLVDWDGEVHTASWEPAEESAPRWRTIGRL